MCVCLGGSVEHQSRNLVVAVQSKTAPEFVSKHYKYSSFSASALFPTVFIVTQYHLLSAVHAPPPLPLPMWPLPPCGHRSLVALSLILSLLLFKPAPVYILDEVDAALDLSHTQV